VSDNRGYSSTGCQTHSVERIYVAACIANEL